MLVCVGIEIKINAIIYNTFNMSAIRTVTKYVDDARIIYKALNGIVVLYKPPVLHFNNLRETVISNLCRGS